MFILENIQTVDCDIITPFSLHPLNQKLLFSFISKTYFYFIFIEYVKMGCVQDAKICLLVVKKLFIFNLNIIQNIKVPMHIILLSVSITQHDMEMVSSWIKIIEYLSVYI